jgi:hypothetical protein
MLLSAVASVLAVGSLSGAGAANATGACISGVNLGTCDSTFGNVALAVGDGTANATGGFLTTAVSFGESSADSAGVLTAAVSTPGALAFSDGIGTLALAGGPGYLASAGEGGGIMNVGNFSVNLGTEPGQSTVIVSGFGNFGGNFFGRASNVVAGGIGILGLNAFSDDTNVLAGIGPNPMDPETNGILNAGFNLGGNHNFVATDGFGAVAGALGVSDRTPTQSGFGFNIDVP